MVDEREYLDALVGVQILENPKQTRGIWEGSAQREREQALSKEEEEEEMAHFWPSHIPNH
jgi:hypothetical protein